MSNETPNIECLSREAKRFGMFFDNLQMTHIKGPLLEESHYYPFGTEMQGISSRALPSYVPNRYKANAGAEYGDEEWSNGSGLEMYETFYRSYNAQIGRFMQGDPMMEVSMESYVFGKNNPASFTDYFGDLETAEYKTLEEIVVKKYSFSNTAQNVSDWVDILLASSEFGGSGDWSFLGENNGGGGGGNSSGTKKSVTNSVGLDTIPKKSATAIALPWALTLSESDGPLLYGDAAAGLLLTGTYIYDHWDDIVSTANSIGSFFDRLFSSDEKTADELLPGSLKKSPSYYPPYGNKTRSELDALGRSGDIHAQKMKKLIDQKNRLLDKNRNK